MKCLDCSTEAFWLNEVDNLYYCDEHVPRGCKCNYRSLLFLKFNSHLVEGVDYQHIPSSESIELLDNGKLKPCFNYKPKTIIA